MDKYIYVQNRGIRHNTHICGNLYIVEAAPQTGGEEWTIQYVVVT